jgi:hypothetical protein
MEYDLAAQRYEDLAIELVDENDGVTVGPDGLLVRGKLFAFLTDADLVVEIPNSRAADLVSRGVAEPYVSGGHPDRNWVRVSSLELWPELAREAHEFVGAPPVGGQS